MDRRTTRYRKNVELDGATLADLLGDYIGDVVLQMMADDDPYHRPVITSHSFHHWQAAPGGRIRVIVEGNVEETACLAQIPIDHPDMVVATCGERVGHAGPHRSWTGHRWETTLSDAAVGDS